MSTITTTLTAEERAELTNAGFTLLENKDRIIFVKELPDGYSYVIDEFSTGWRWSMENKNGDVTDEYLPKESCDFPSARATLADIVENRKYYLAYITL